MILALCKLADVFGSHRVDQQDLGHEQKKASSHLELGWNNRDVSTVEQLVEMVELVGLNDQLVAKKVG